MPSYLLCAHSWLELFISSQNLHYKDKEIETQEFKMR